MSQRMVAIVLTVIAVAMPGPAPLAAQSAEPATPRTPWGDPDLQGVWDFRTIIPLERPDERVRKQLSSSRRRWTRTRG